MAAYLLDDQVSPFWGAKRLRLAAEAAGIALWSWNADSNQFEMDDDAFALWGVPPRLATSFDQSIEHVHPADQHRTRAAFAATRSVAGAYQIDFRVVAGDGVRWLSARGKAAGDQSANHMMFGILLDVTAQKQAQEHHELLAGEMSHRVKNLLSVTAALTAVTARSSSSVQEMAAVLTDRLVALGRAHDLTRPTADRAGGGALLGDLLAVLMAPYVDANDRAARSRVQIRVPGARIGEGAAAALALVIHELATNSLKYGALSAAAGSIALSGRRSDGRIHLLWAERGCPAVPGPSSTEGFGSTLLRRIMASQLGGTIAYEWRSCGVDIILEADNEHMNR